MSALSDYEIRVRGSSRHYVSVLVGLLSLGRWLLWLLFVGGPLAGLLVVRWPSVVARWVTVQPWGESPSWPSGICQGLRVARRSCRVGQPLAADAGGDGRYLHASGWQSGGVAQLAVGR